jgi:hypothetical protein
MNVKGQGGTSKNYQEATKWLQRAGMQGVIEAQYNLAIMYGRGIGVPKVYKKAVNWHFKVIKQEDKKSAARDILSFMKIIGDKQEADQNIHDILGFIKIEDNEIPERYFQEALKWTTKAAEKGIAEAQYVLGYIYYNGKGASRSFPDAVRWFEASAEKGHTEAQFSLGKMYVEGQVRLENDYVLGYTWFNLAAAKGHEEAKLARDRISEEMPEDKIKKAQTFSRELLKRINSQSR